MESDGVDEAILFEETALLANTLSREYVIENKMTRKNEFTKLLGELVSKKILTRDQCKIKVRPDLEIHIDLHR